MLLACWSHIFFTSASKDANAIPHDAADNTTELRASSQYYRPYYYNRRPSYTSNYNGNNRRPVYPTNCRPIMAINYGTNQRPNYLAVAPTVNRPGPTSTLAQITAEVVTYAAGHFCNAPETAASNLGPPGICWDSANRKLKTSPSLTMGNFVSFFSRVEKTRLLGGNSEFRDQICEQSRRFNNVALICVPFRNVPYDTSVETHSDVECPSNARQASGNCYGTNCICYLDQYHMIAQANKNHYHNLFQTRLLNVAVAMALGK